MRAAPPSYDFRPARIPTPAPPPESAALEGRLIRAYVHLFLAPANDGGPRTVPLARFGSYEVRLLEFADQPGEGASEGAMSLWMELYCHDLRSAIDSCSCSDVEEAVLAAGSLLSQARRLDESERSGRLESFGGGRAVIRRQSNVV